MLFTALQDVLKWMYQRNIDGASKKAADLLEAAEYFQIGGLKQMCIRN
jgi:hypothetical protein